MPSAFGHAAASLLFGNLYKIKSKIPLGLLLTGVFCSILPDIDVLAFKFGIPYESTWGHRGITHSFLFAFLWAWLLSFFFKQKQILSFSFLFFCTVSHTLLDAVTTGGLGVAFFAPFNNTRYFLPWQFIKVSPLGLKNFISIKGINVLKSEFIFIGIPVIMSYILLFINKQKKL